MALSLPGERSRAPAIPSRPLAAIVRWIGRTKAARTRRAALRAMLELDADRLQDLGIAREDILQAMAHKTGSAMALNSARARNARL